MWDVQPSDCWEIVYVALGQKKFEDPRVRTLHGFQPFLYRDPLHQGHQRGARWYQVARTDHVGRPGACSENSINMISVFTKINIFNNFINDNIIEDKLSKFLF